MSALIDEQWKKRIFKTSVRENDKRSPYQRDRGRVLHSAAFRCLQGKTQIHAVGENDFYRTRLTHSLEVAQIGSSLSRQLRLDSAFSALTKVTNSIEQLNKSQLKTLLPSVELIETLCFAHDIGHPPFGHGGEVALNYKMAKHGGFEGNGQTFRLLTRLEPYTQSAGMNLTRRTLLGVLKYPVILDEVSPQYAQIPELEYHSQILKKSDWVPGKGVFRDDLNTLEWLLEPLSEHDRAKFQKLYSDRVTAKEILKTTYKSLDCSIMELADDIAYSIHDLEDAIVLGVVNQHQWHVAYNKLQKSGSAWIVEHLDELTEKLFSAQHFERKNAIGSLVNYFITSVHWHIEPEFNEVLLRYNAKLPDEVYRVLTIFKQFVYEFVISHVDTQRIEYKGQRILLELFDIFSSAPERLLPENTVNRWKNAGKSGQHRVICDYIAGMSDAYALKVYHQL